MLLILRSFIISIDNDCSTWEIQHINVKANWNLVRFTNYWQNMKSISNPCLIVELLHVKLTD